MSSPIAYSELHAHSAFSLLDGASSPEALVARAHELGLCALTVVDQDDLGGAVRLHRAALEVGLPVVHGASLTLEDGSSLPLLVRDREGWGNLCRLVSLARTTSPRGAPRTSLERLSAHSGGLLALTGDARGPLARALARDDEPRALTILGRLVEVFGRDHLRVEVGNHHLPWERRLAERLVTLSRRSGVDWVPTQGARYAHRGDAGAYDVLTCLRHQVTLEDAGDRLLPNAEWGLKSPQEMAALFPGDEAAIARTIEVAQACGFSLQDLSPTLPRYEHFTDAQDDAQDDAKDDDTTLARMAFEGASQRYGPALSEAHRRQLHHELSLIARLGLAGYFLIVADIVGFARREKILVQGRGSAANSVVCYCLGITSVDPVAMDLLFERFLSEERTDPPDIDVDIEHHRREEVLQYVYERYGRDHAAMVCETITWRGKSAVRDVARVLGLDGEVAAQLALEVGRSEASEAAEHLKQGGAERAGLAPDSPTTRALLDVLSRLDRLPRHRSIHTGGFVLTAEPLNTIVPIESASMADRTVIQWDKDDLGPVGLVKIDLLGLGILTVIADTLETLRDTRGLALDLSELPTDDAAVYEQISRADTVGLFQIESRAQMNSLPRTRPDRFYDLVVQVAIIRPGPIQGEMVHPYIRRRRGEEPVTYLHPDLEPVLERTLGVPLFQEQGMKVAIAMAGFTPGQADRLRKVMGFKRAPDHLPGILKDLWQGMADRGVDEPTRLRILKQLEGFASYGFPESHAASFALLTYASAWLRHHFAPEYLAALLNAQPMGFYSPSTLVEDARHHGVEIRPMDLVFSRWRTTLETDGPAPAVRLGFHLVRGLGSRARASLERTLGDGRVGSLDELVTRAGEHGLPDEALHILARAGAFRTLWPGRRQALWALIRRLVERQSSLPLSRPDDRPLPLPSMTLLEETAADYATLGLSHQVHPMTFHRRALRERGVVSSSDLATLPHGTRVRVGGLVICRQRPGSAKGVFFMTLEDEHGMANIIVMPDLFERDRVALVTASTLIVHGTLERHQRVINVLAHRFEPLEPRGGSEHPRSHDFH
jgi:error-prone DNA polymerase